MTKDKAVNAVLIAILLGFAFWSGGNYQLANEYTQQKEAQKQMMEKLNG